MIHGSSWPKVLGNVHHVPGECRVMPAAAPAHQRTVLWVGCWAQAHVANSSHHASPIQREKQEKSSHVFRRCSSRLEEEAADLAL